MKKILSMVLILTLLLSLFQITVFAETNEETDTISNKLILKDKLLEKYYNRFKSNGALEEGIDYTWDYCEIKGTGTSTQQCVTPCWSVGNSVKKVTHNIIIDNANELAKDDGDASFVPVKYLALAKKVSEKCDTGDENKGITKVGAIHGTGNYVVTFKYLWQFTKKLNQYKEKTTISNNTLDNYISNAHTAGIVGIPATLRNTNNFSDMKNFVRKMLKSYYNDRRFAWEEGQILGKRCKFIMFGIIFHFMGDLYAHRTVVPKMCAKTLINSKEAETYNMIKIDYNDQSSIHPTKYFNPEVFKKFSRYSALKRGICTGSIHSSAKVSFGELKLYKYATDEDATAAKTDGTASLLNKAYVDNGNFYSERVDEATGNIALFMICFSKGYDLIVIDTVFVNLEKFQIYIDAVGDNYKYRPVV